ncbi:MAG: hypothetical protein JWO63_1701 [Frankiales bacterium]|jgi:hypothetical protein|nr:hypothetical protein [Frankiales bacterium]
MTESPERQPRSGDSVFGAAGNRQRAGGPRPHIVTRIDLQSPALRKRWAVEASEMEIELREQRSIRRRRVLWSLLVAFLLLDIAAAWWLGTSRL